MRKPNRRPLPRTNYSLMSEVMASPSEPLPEFWRTTQLASMWVGLDRLKVGVEAAPDDWRCCSDAVNLMETFTVNGPWLDCGGDRVTIEDAQGLLQDAVTALALAGKRHMAGRKLELLPEEWPAVTAVLEDYAELIAVLPQRQMIRCHRLTEKRIHELLAGRGQKHDVEIVTA